MEFIDRYQEIVAKAIEKHSFKNKPTELYKPDELHHFYMAEKD